MKYSIDMVHGPLLGKILLFSLPLIASNILQMLFNAADNIVVGRFVGYVSLAAVGSTATLIALVVNILIGLSTGVNVVVARYLGSSAHEDKISRSVHTAMTLAMGGGVVFGLLGIACSNLLLAICAVPEDVRPLALVYLRIYFIGTPFLAVYNYGASILRASGDTRRPLIFMLVSGVLNVILNLIFVVVFNLDVAGVAWATVISEGLSAFLIVNYLLKENNALRFSWKKLHIDINELKAISNVGIPTALQSILFCVANIAIQSNINAYGSVVIAGVSAASNIENFVYIGMNAFRQACQTFVSQNLGAGEENRVGRVVELCLLCTLVIGLLESLIIIIFESQLISFFNTDPEVIQQGCLRLNIVVSLYVLYGFCDILMGGFLGYGISLSPMIINLICTCAFRLLWLSQLDTSKVSVAWVHASFPASWVFLLVVLAVYWVTMRHKRRKKEHYHV